MSRAPFIPIDYAEDSDLISSDIFRRSLRNYQSPALGRSIDSDMSSIPETLRPSPLGQGSSSSSRFTIATPVGPSSPSPLINQPSIKDCPHRGDLLGHRTETSRASHGVMAMDPPSPPQPIPLTGLIRPGSISAMLREMQQELPQRPFFPSGTNILRPIAPLPLRRADVSTDTQTPFDPFSLSSASNGREDQLLIFRQPQDHRAIAAPVPNRIRPSSQNAPMSQRQSGNAYESTGMESIPAPRASRRAENHEEEHERIDFSPHRLGRRPRDIEWSTSAFRPTRSREHDDRLVRLDALRAGDIHDVGVIAPSHANLPSTRQGRHPMDESRDFRSRQASSEITPMDIDRWNRDIHEAIERRVGDALSPASAVMRHQEIVTASQPYQSPMVFSQPTGSRWGDLNPASPQRRNRFFHLERSLGVLDTMSGESVSLDGFDDQDTFYADINWDEAERLFDFASSSSETLLAQVHGTIGVNRLTETMSKDEKMRKIRSAAKGVSRWPGHCRRSAAEETLHMLPWKDVVNSEEMIKDAYCSVCHDDYEEDSQITVTPCKHMYHKECLDTWLHTPNTSSCPMCRRDLAVLLCITRMVPTQSRREALPLWLEL